MYSRIFFFKFAQWIFKDCNFNYIPYTGASSIRTQGSGSSWVKTFKVQYSLDAEVWVMLQDDLNNEMTFSANSDATSIFTNELPYGLIVQHLRIMPQTYQTSIALRVDVYGCAYNRKTVLKHLLYVPGA